MPIYKNRAVCLEGLTLLENGKSAPVTKLAIQSYLPLFCGPLHRTITVAQDLSLSAVIAPSSSAPESKPGLAGPNVAQNAPDKREFAKVFTGQMLKQERQRFAESDTDAESDSRPATGDSTPDAALHVVSISDKLNIVTLDSPLPDLSSLAAFARSQGLGDSAISQLLGIPPVLSPSAGTPLPFDFSTPTAPVLSPDSTGLGLSPAAFGSNPAAGLVAPTSSELARSLENWGAKITGLEIHQNPSEVANNAAAKEASTFVAAQAFVTAFKTPLGLSAQEQLAATADLQSTPLVPGLQNALQLRLQWASQEVGKRLAQLNGSNQAVTWSALTSDLASLSAGRAPALDVLTLALPDGMDELSLVSAQTDAEHNTTDTGINHSSASAAQLPLTSSAEPQKTPAGSAEALAQARAAQTQQLADRMGEALAQKLINQIERGQWKLHLQMQPGALGRVEIDLHMHSGGLDALFSADNAMTREMINQGSNRLKDTLSQSGTSVASFTVNADAKGQSGGNPTPQRFVKAPQDDAEIASVGSARATGPSAREIVGLDLLA